MMTPYPVEKSNSQHSKGSKRPLLDKDDPRAGLDISGFSGLQSSQMNSSGIQRKVREILDKEVLKKMKKLR